MIQNCQICKKVTVNTSENSFRLSHVPSFFHRLKTGSLIKKWIDSLPSYRVLADPQNIICFPTAVFFLLSKIPELRWSCNCRNMAIKKLPHRDGSVTVDKKLQAEKEIGSIYLYPKKNPSNNLWQVGFFWALQRLNMKETWKDEVMRFLLPIIFHPCN